ncbi:MAG: electron transfer flavoprotein-ubiquinone oxidoreductase [bacterium]
MSEEIERESMSCAALIVGGGPAGLAAAIHLKNLIDKHNEKNEKKLDLETLGTDMLICLIEKGAAIGSHSISGAVMNPVALAELIPDFKEKGAPLEYEVTHDEVYHLSATGARKLPITPPTMHNDGNHTISLGKLVKWLGEQAEALEIDIFPAFTGQDIVIEGSSVKGILTGDKGINPDGTPKGNFEPGMNLLAKCTVFAEGSRGSLTKQLVKKLGLDNGKNPQVYATGVKEVWEVKPENCPGGRVIHTMGWPNDNMTFGGGFIYDMQENRLAVGYITALDYKDPLLDPHKQFSKFKTHPLVKKLLEGGKMVSYGAKTLPEGGYYSVPKPYGDGFIIAGDSASLINVPKLKGVHYAIKSGILAAETIFEGLLQDNLSESATKNYEQKLNDSYIFKEMRPARNFRALFKKGFMMGMVKAGITIYTGGRYPWTMMKLEDDHLETQKLSARHPQGAPEDTFKFDGELTFDKLTDVYNSGATHEEKQPCHLRVEDTNICATKCKEEYGNPCTKFCPAEVYEMEQPEGSNEVRLKINFSNCVHCKTCDIKDPYGIITWVCPEGGGGPSYNLL